jgi:hypothetical protein
MFARSPSVPSALVFISSSLLSTLIDARISAPRVLWVPTDLNLHIEAEFDFSYFFSLSLAPGINRNFMAYIFYISG